MPGSQGAPGRCGGASIVGGGCLGGGGQESGEEGTWVISVVGDGVLGTGRGGVSGALVRECSVEHWGDG